MSESYWTDKVALTYRELEEELVEIIIKRLKVGTNNKKDITQWQFEKLQDLGLINQQTIKKIAEASKRTEKEVSEAFRVGPDEVIQQVDRASQQPRKVPSTNTDQIIKGYAKQARMQLNLTNEKMGLWTYDSGDTIQKYRGIIERTASFVNTGIHTLEQAVERASHEILTEGLKTTMRDKKGRKIPVDSYVRTVMKTNLAQTYDEVRKEHMEEYGMHHVVVGSLVGAREACSKIQGQVVDLRPMEEIPEGSEYKSIYDPYWEAHYKEAGGHHGVNCRHPHFPFIPGVNTNNQPQYDEALNEQVAKDQQKQRSLERQIREYKKHLKIAQEFGNQKDIDRYTKLISGRQKALREHLDGHKYLSRDYARERAFDFSSSPPKDIVKPVIPEVVPEPVIVEVKPSPRTYENVIKNADERLEDILFNEGLVSMDVNDEFRKEMLNLIDKNHLGAKVPDLDILDSILDTHFKNQFETGTSGGINDPGKRKDITSKLFGLSNNEVNALAPREFEKYGYLISNDLKDELIGFNATSHYGDVVVTFKKETMNHRTTFTLGDSLNQTSGDVVGVPITDPSIAAHSKSSLKMAADPDTLIGRMNEDIVDNVNDPGQAMHLSGFEYAELQFHGEITANDIEKVAFSQNTMDTIHGADRVAEIVAKLKSLNIEVEIIGGQY